jgi:hypothetical protein
MNKGNLKMTDAGYVVGANVNIIKRDKKTGRVLEKREGHNRCLRMQLMGITKFLNGEFNNTTYQTAYDWIPRYLGLGTNVATVDSSSSIKTEVQLNDTRLLDEISPRLKLPDRNTVVNRTSQSYVQLIITTYLPEEYYNGQTIREAGLFSKASGNNCLFRIVFDDITKDRDSVVEVTWTISIISIDSENEPYEEYSKADLREGLNEIIERTAELYPPYSDIISTLEDVIYECIRTDSTEESIQKATDSVTALYVQMKDWEHAGIPDEVEEQIDDINGEDV